MWYTRLLRYLLKKDQTLDRDTLIESISWIALFTMVACTFLMYGLSALFAWFFFEISLFLYWWLTLPDKREDDPRSPASLPVLEEKHNLVVKSTGCFLFIVSL